MMIMTIQRLLLSPSVFSSHREPSFIAESAYLGYKSQVVHNSLIVVALHTKILSREQSFRIRFKDKHQLEYIDPIPYLTLPTTTLDPSSTGLTAWGGFRVDFASLVGLRIT